MKKAVKVRIHSEDSVMLTNLNKERSNQHGFGTFFWQINPQEIDIDKETLNFVRDCVGREYSSIGDLFGAVLDNAPAAMVEAQRGFYVNFASTEDSLVVPLVDLRVNLELYMELHKILYD